MSDIAPLEPLRPLNADAYSKHLFDLYAQRAGLLDRIVGLKYFNVFGPNEDHEGEYGKRGGTHHPWPGVPKCHLLDGQQRCNAISLGFYDLFSEGMESSELFFKQWRWMEISMLGI